MNHEFPVIKAAREFSVGEGPTAVLMSHGFTGSVASMRPWAEGLASAGYHVDVPRLPGHGTHWRDLARTRYTAWVDHLLDRLDALRADHERVAVAGLSMGGGLALRMAQLRPDVAAIMLVNPAVASNDPRFGFVGALKHVVPTISSIANDIAARDADGNPAADECAYGRTPLRAVHEMTKLWSDVRADMARIQQPLLLFRSDVDHIVDDASHATILAQVSSGDVTMERLPESFHVATLDHDGPFIISRSAAWLAERT